MVFSGVQRTVRTRLAARINRMRQFLGGLGQRHDSNRQEALSVRKAVGTAGWFLERENENGERFDEFCETSLVLPVGCGRESTLNAANGPWYLSRVDDRSSTPPQG